MAFNADIRNSDSPNIHDKNQSHISYHLSSGTQIICHLSYLHIFKGENLVNQFPEKKVLKPYPMETACCGYASMNTPATSTELHLNEAQNPSESKLLIVDQLLTELRHKCDASSTPCTYSLSLNVRSIPLQGGFSFQQCI